MMLRGRDQKGSACYVEICRGGKKKTKKQQNEQMMFGFKWDAFNLFTRRSPAAVTHTGLKLQKVFFPFLIMQF